MVYIAPNTPSRPGAPEPQREPRAVANFKQRIRIRADRDRGTSAVRMTPQSTTGMRILC